jgi:hypothetical protein
MLSWLGFSLLIACSPVNNKPADLTNAANFLVKGAPQEAVTFSAQREFVVAMKLLGTTPLPTTNEASVDPADGTDADGNLKTDAAKVQAKLGDNQYLINLRHGSDLGPVTNQLLLSVQFEHVSAKIKKLFQAKLTAQEDGSFLATIQFPKNGTWKIHVHSTDGDLDDETIFQVKF